MTFDEKELKAIKKYLETLLNIGYSIENIDGQLYIPVKDLREDLKYIRNCLHERTK